MLGIYVHNIKDSKGNTTTKGKTPFDNWIFKKKKDKFITYPVYEWVSDDVYKNMGDWIEKSCQSCRKINS